MAKKIKDYLHFYIGQRFIQTKDPDKKQCVLTSKVFFEIDGSNLWKPIKLLLRPISDMTAKERKDCGWSEALCNNIKKYGIQVSPEELKWLISKGFDVFNLIDAGLAIDKTKITAP